MIEYTLPWPPKELSPNARLHWASLARWKKKYKRACWATTLEQMPTQLPMMVLDQQKDIVLTMEFVPPQRRTYDRDNLSARMKAGIDGMARALGIDDSIFTEVVSKVATDRIGGFVKITITGEKNGN